MCINLTKCFSPAQIWPPRSFVAAFFQREIGLVFSQVPYLQIGCDVCYRREYLRSRWKMAARGFKLQGLTRYCGSAILRLCRQVQSPAPWSLRSNHFVGLRHSPVTASDPYPLRRAPSLSCDRLRSVGSALVGDVPIVATVMWVTHMNDTHDKCIIDRCLFLDNEPTIRPHIRFQDRLVTAGPGIVMATL